MLKFKVTNVSTDQPRFITEAGRLLKPGQSITVNRLDAGTRKDKALKIEEGEFAPPAPQTKLVVAPPDDDDDEPVAKKVPPETGPAHLVDTKSAKRVVPLEAVTSVPALEGAEKKVDHADAATDGGADDELDGLVAKADKVVDKSEAAGFNTHTGTIAPGKKDDEELGR